jgi:hypothetical protein
LRRLNIGGNRRRPGLATNAWASCPILGPKSTAISPQALVAALDNPSKDGRPSGRHVERGNAVSDGVYNLSVVVVTDRLG